MSYVVTRERTAAHESGHAVVFAAVGIPVLEVLVRTERSVVEGRNYTRHGYTPTDVDKWAATSGMSKISVFIRRALGNAGGFVGESLGGFGDANTLEGTKTDMSQIAACLLELDVLKPGETLSPELAAIVIFEAERILESNRAAFDNLRSGFAPSHVESLPCPSIAVLRTEQEDELLLKQLLNAVGRA